MKDFLRKLFGLILVLLAPQLIHAQTLNEVWKRVEKAAQDGNPQEVILQSGKMYDLARQQRNVPEMLRAYLTRMNWREDLAPDSLEQDQQGLLRWAQETKDPVDQSVLRFVYGMVAQNDTASTTVLRQAVALDSPSLFQKLSVTSALNYKPVVIEGKGSKLYHHDLLSLYRRTLSQQVSQPWITQLFQRDRDFYLSHGNREAALSVALEWEDTGNLPETRTAFLEDLAQQYADLPLCAEVQRRLAQHEKKSEAITRLKQALATYPKYAYLDELRQDLDALVHPSGHFSIPQNGYPEKPVQVTYHVINIQTLHVALYRLPQSAFLQENQKQKELRKQGTLVWEKDLKVTDTPFLQVDSAFTFTAPATTGCYLLELRSKESADYPTEKSTSTYLPLTISTLRPVAIPFDGKKMEIQVLDEWTGHPVPQATLARYLLDRKQQTYQLKETLQTDAEGKLVYPVNRKEGMGYWSAEKDGEKSRIRSLSGDFYSREQSAKERRVEVFTDRSLYRPGQEVLFSAIVWNQKSDSIGTASDAEIEVRLYGRTRKEIQKLTLKTDAFGVAAGKFLLPKDAETGYYTLRTDEGETQIQVEEYKRPTFDVRWEPTEEAYAEGDTVQLIGVAQTFTDLPVQHARVEVHTVLRERLFWRTRGETVLQTDTLYTDERGRFTLPVTLNIPSPRKGHTLYQFEVRMTVTSQDGETHTAQTQLILRNTPAVLWTDLPGRINKQKPASWTIHLENAGGRDLQQEVHLELLDKETQKTVWTGTQTSGTSFPTDFLRNLLSTAYTLRLTCDTLHAEQDFVLYSMTDARPIGHQPLWVYQEDTDIQFGTSLQDAYITYHIYNKVGRLESRSVILSDQLQLLHLPYKPEYGDGITVCFSLLYQGEYFEQSVAIQKPLPEKKMKSEWISFRDETQPGAAEIWRLRLSLPNGRAAAANLMAVLYDASLDRIVPHHWHLGVRFNRWLPSVNLSNRQWNNSAQLSFPAAHTYKIGVCQYDALDDNLLMHVYYGRMMGNEVMMLSASAPAMAKGMRMAKADLAVEESAIADAAVATEEGERPAETPIPVKLRSDFKETAFFFPALRTDRNGEVQLEFTLPQSITEWHLLGLAHTQEMDYTTDMNEHIKVKQPFLVQPNLPRFIRKGDQVNLPVTVRNQSGEMQQGDLVLVLKDSTLVRVLHTQKLSFQVEPSGEQTYAFSFRAPDYVGGAICQIYAQGADYSDGEQHELPVLSDEVWLEENRAYYLNSSKQVVSLENLLGHGKLWNETSMLTVKMVNNPLGEVVRELQENEQKEPAQNVVDLTLAYYVQCLSGACGLPSDGKKAQEYLAQLEKLQQTDGGFAWFHGMPTSAYLTRLVTEALVRLSTLEVKHASEEQFNRIIRRSMHYLDGEMLRYYQWIQKQKKQTEISYETVHYLYLCALNPHLMSNDCKAACQYFLNLLPRNLNNQSIYLRSMSALVLEKNNRHEEAQKFIRSVVSYSVCTEELGRYYDTNRAPYSWRNYKIPTQTLVIEAVQKVAQAQVQVTSEQTVEKQVLLTEYLKWLLNQKRTQHWESTDNTLDALYALLNTEGFKQPLPNSDGQTVIQHYTHTDLPQLPREWTLERQKTDSPMAWGSISVKSLVKIDDVHFEEPHTGFTLEVEYQKEVVENGKKTYKQVAEKELHVGDKVRRVARIKTDRDMDFVELCCPRAACLEPAQQLSGYRWGGNVGYYYQLRDQESRFFMDHLTKGTHELIEEFFVTLRGTYSTGIPQVRCTYAPEFGTHGESIFLCIY